MDGAVYEWNALSGQRESESVLKSCSYTSVAFSHNTRSTLAVGNDHTLKEIQDYQVSPQIRRGLYFGHHSFTLKLSDRFSN